jgi:hypothetical protein
MTRLSRNNTIKEIGFTEFTDDVGNYAKIELWPISRMRTENCPEKITKGRKLVEVTPPLKKSWSELLVTSKVTPEVELLEFRTCSVRIALKCH